MNLQSIKQRFSNPIFRLAFAGFIYQTCKQLGIELDESLFRTFVDIVSWLLLGAGVYVNFDDTQSGTSQDAPPPSEE